MNKIREFQRGDTVLCRSYVNPNKWSTGQVQEKLGNLHYKVKVGGNIVHRHIDQLKATIKTEPEPQNEYEIIDLTSDDNCPSFSGDASDPHGNVDDNVLETPKREIVTNNDSVDVDEESSFSLPVTPERESEELPAFHDNDFVPMRWSRRSNKGIPPTRYSP